jgi:hypothetical protein
MGATKYLPANYRHKKTLNLSRTRAVLWMNLAAIPLLVLFGWLFSYLINIFNTVNPFHSGILGLFRTFSILELFFCILIIILMLVLHELVHGIFFWLFTHDKPRFAIKTGYAFAAAPEWYLTRMQYIIVGLSPFMIISIISIILTCYVNASLIPYLLLSATFNAAGSLGDFIVVGWIISQPYTILVKDEGDIFSTYSPNNDLHL